MNENKNVSKKAYSTPTLTTHGDVEKLTLDKGDRGGFGSGLKPGRGGSWWGKDNQDD